MWNNITHGNTNMNKFERLMEDKGHLERLTQAKKVINTKNPITPSFITKKMINPGTKMERAMKINYENHLIYNRMYGISCKNSPYSACMNIPSKCPAYELLTYHRLKKKCVILTENNKLYKRFTFAKPTFTTRKLSKEYEYSKYLQKNISENGNRANPNLEFVGFSKFNERIKSFSVNGKKFKKMKLKLLLINSNNSLINSIERPRSCYNSKKQLIPNFAMYNTENCSKKCIHNKSYNDSIQKPKLKRPNSCRHNIVINREVIDNEKDIFNELPINNESKKTQKTQGTKPASGKTRTNGSYSTNIMTSP